jgi:hypothetical protein
MKVSLSMILLPKSGVKCPINREKVMGKVALVTDEFLVLAGWVKWLEAFLALYGVCQALIIAHTAELSLKWQNGSVLVGLEHFQSDLFVFKRAVKFFCFLDELNRLPHFNPVFRDVMKQKNSKDKGHRMCLATLINMEVNIVRNMLADEKEVSLKVVHLLPTDS